MEGTADASLGMPMEPEGQEEEGLDSTPVGEGGVVAAVEPMEGEEEEEDEEEEARKVAVKKYQDFQEACEELLDPGQWKKACHPEPRTMLIVL